MTPQEAIIAAIESAGFRFEYTAALPAEGVHADTNQTDRLVRLGVGLAPATAIFCLAHELGHVIRGDQVNSADVERGADRFATEFLAKMCFALTQVGPVTVTRP